MADKKITELQLRDNVTDDVNFPSDDGIQSYRVTAAQIKAYILANNAIATAMIQDAAVTAAKLAASVQAALVPSGSVLPFAGSSAPTGYLLCDGSAVSRSTYSALYAVIGVTHGQGDNSTTFNLPDYRGRFMRGVDGAQGRDPDRASRTAMATGGNTGDNVGSIQGHSFQTHTHIQDAHAHAYVKGPIDGSSASNGIMGANYGGSPATMSGAILSNTATNQNASATGTHAQASSNETRPVNVYVNYIIKT